TRDLSLLPASGSTLLNALKNLLSALSSPSEGLRPLILLIVSMNSESNPRRASTSDLSLSPASGSTLLNALKNLLSALSSPSEGLRPLILLIVSMNSESNPRRASTSDLSLSPASGSTLLNALKNLLRALSSPSEGLNPLILL